MQMSETLAKLQNLQDVLGEKYAIKSNVDELPKTLNGSRESLERFKKEYIEKNTKGRETLVFKGSQYLEWIIEKLLADPKDAKKLCRREKAAVARRKSWGLDS